MVFAARKSLSLSYILCRCYCKCFCSRTLYSHDVRSLTLLLSLVVNTASCCSGCVRIGVKVKFCSFCRLCIFLWPCHWCHNRATGRLWLAACGQWDTEHRCTVLRALYSTVAAPCRLLTLLALGVVSVTIVPLRLPSPAHQPSQLAHSQYYWISWWHL